MENPGIRTLAKFLSLVATQQPTTRQRISDAMNRAYGMVNRYLEFSLDKRLIRVSKIERNKGPMPQKFYVLTSTGRDFIKVLEKI